MPMPPYPLYCYSRGCKHLAAYKIAARWSDGVVSELKTYGLCCEEHLKDWLGRARDKQKACHLTQGESLEAPGVDRLERGARDQTLERLTEREQQLSAEGA